MAASGPLADFARLPTQRKILMFVVIGFLLGAVYWQFFFKGLNKDIEEAEADHDAKVAQNTKLTADLPAYEKLQTKFSQLQKKVTENQKALPTQAELPAFFETLNRKVKDSGVEIKNWSQAPEEPVDVFVKVPVKIEITGTFMQIKRFFASLVQKSDTTTPVTPDTQKERERVVSIESLALGDAKVVNHELILTAKFTATTFRQDELKVVTPVAKPGAAPPPPPAGASSAPPMPSAATPTGAKLRVEDSMKKDQERTDTGTAKATANPTPPSTTPPTGSGAARLKGGQ